MCLDEEVWRKAEEGEALNEEPLSRGFDLLPLPQDYHSLLFHPPASPPLPSSPLYWLKKNGFTSLVWWWSDRENNSIEAIGRHSGVQYERQMTFQELGLSVQVDSMSFLLLEV